MTGKHSFGSSQRGWPIFWQQRWISKLLTHGLPAVLLLALAGCDLSVDAINGYEPVTRTETDGGTGGDGGSSGGDTSTTRAYVRVVNNYPYNLHAVYVSSCSSSTWGSNRLDGLIVSGSSDTFGPFSTGCYDLRADAVDGKQFVLQGANLEGGTFVAETN